MPSGATTTVPTVWEPSQRASGLAEYDGRSSSTTFSELGTSAVGALTLLTVKRDSLPVGLPGALHTLGPPVPPLQ